MPTMTPTPALPSLRDRALITLQDIERLYALGSGDYRHEAGKNSPSFAWAHGILASAFVSGTENLDRKRFVPLMRRQLDALNRGYFRPEGPVPGYNASRNQSGGTDRYYDDNAWLALAWADAARITGDLAYQTAAQKAYDFAISGHTIPDKKGGGVYWHEKDFKSQNTCSTAPTAVYAIETARDTQTTRQLYAWLLARLRDPADGLYWDNVSPTTGHVEKTKWSYNTALVLRLESSLAEKWRSNEYLQRADFTANACVSHWYKPTDGILTDGAAFAHLLNENLLRTGKITGNKVATQAALQSLDTLWLKLRRSDGTYPKDWNVSPDRMEKDKSSELISIASAARAYAFAAGFVS